MFCTVQCIFDQPQYKFPLGQLFARAGTLTDKVLFDALKQFF